MDEIIYGPTVAISMIILCIYVYYCFKHDQTFDMTILVSSVLAASGISGGGFLMLATVIPSLKEKLSNLNLYIFIAGLVVLAVSILSIHREITKQKKG